MSWRDKLKIEQDHKVIFVRQFDAGNLGQEERKYYDIVDRENKKVGEVKYVEYMNINTPFNRSFLLQQYDLEGQVVVFERW